MYHMDRCDFCGDCLASCRFMDFDREGAEAAIRDLAGGACPDWLNQCVTCFACDESCPNDAHPFELICRRMEERGDYVPPEILDKTQRRFAVTDDFSVPEVSDPVISLCTIAHAVPHAFSGRMFEGASFVKGRFFFCNVLYLHMGNWSLMEREMRNLVDRYAGLKVERIIFAHDDCYTHMKLAEQMGIEIPFKVAHLFDYLLDYLQNHRGDICCLDKSIAYQRPCASRYTAEKDEVLDQILQLIGVRRVQRAFDGSNALCCGQNLGGILPARQNMEPYQALNVADAKDHGAAAMVFLCPMCLAALRSKCLANGLEPLFIVDLCRLALGEKTEPASM